MFDYKNKFVVEAFVLVLCTITLLLCLAAFISGITVGNVGFLKDNLGAILTFVGSVIGAILLFLGPIFVLIKKQQIKELEKQQEQFKSIHSFYLSKSQKYLFEATKVGSLLEYWTEDRYVQGVHYEWPVSESDVKVPDNYPEPSGEVLGEFELFYPDLYQKYKLLQNHKDYLEMVAAGAHDDCYNISAAAHKDIERYYGYFSETKKELDDAFDIKAKELRLR